MSSTTLESEASSPSTVSRSIEGAAGHSPHPLPPRELITPADIVAHARRATTRVRLIALLELLDNDPIDQARLTRYRADLGDGQTDQPLDTVTIAHAAAEVLAPRRAIEIGVRRGFCAAAIAGAAPEVELHLMDRWPLRDPGGANPNAANPGPVLVRHQLQAVAHRGNAHFHQGDSHALLPHLCLPHHHAPLRFDLVVVDGDRTEAGADQDLRDIFPHVAGGGIVVFDDLNHPQHGYLLDVWRRWQTRLSDQFAFNEHLDEGTGIALAMRLAP